MSKQKKSCWLCGTTENATGHHVLPKALNPLKNIRIPLCDTCHKTLNYFYAGSFEQKSNGLNSKYKELNSMFHDLLDDNIKLTKQIAKLRKRLGD